MQIEPKGLPFSSSFAVTLGTIETRHKMGTILQPSCRQRVYSKVRCRSGLTCPCRDCMGADPPSCCAAAGGACCSAQKLHDNGGLRGRRLTGNEGGLLAQIYALTGRTLDDALPLSPITC